jgi:hypothetical protein
MSYLSEVLTDNPALYPRLDMVGTATNGDAILDSSVNGLDLTMVFAAGTAGGPDVSPGDGIVPFTQPYGRTSPIETDASSREFCGHNYNTGADKEDARITLATNALIEPSGDVALEAWVRPLRGDMGNLIGEGTVKQHLLGKSGSCVIYIDHFNNLAATLYDTSGNFFHVVDPDDFIVGRSYHVVVTRTVNTLALRVDTALKATTSVSSGLPTAAGTEFFIHPGQIAPADCRYDEVAWYLHTLTSTRIGVHFDAAINATLLNGFSNVIPSAILYSDIEPDPIRFPFRHNWEAPLMERVSFLTGLSTARTGAEEGNAVRPKPRREIEWQQVIRDNDERQQLRAKLWANQHRKWLIPILEHREFLAAPLSSGATSIPASTQFKDYQNGGYVHLRELNDTGQITKSEELQILSFTGSAITTTAPTVNSYAANVSQVCPARRGYIQPSIPVRGHAAEVEELTISARLVAEDESATPNRITPWTPTTTYKGYEAYDLAVWQSNDWSELRDYQIDRLTEDIDFEVGPIDTESDTDGAAESSSWRVLLKGNDKIAAFLGWFYYHAGSLVYLWVPSNQRDLIAVSVLGSDLTVSGHAYTENYAGSQARRDVAFVYFDNSMILRRINSSTTSGANDVLTLDGTVPTQTNLRSVSFFKFSRLDADSLEAAKVTDDLWRCAWQFRELLHVPD